MAGKKRKKVGLALGGGGAKGLAHLGVIRALERMGIEISYIAGTSIGAIVGAWYAATGETESLRQFFQTIGPKDISSNSHLFMRHDGAIFKRKEIFNFLESGVDGKQFSDLKIPFAAVATDAATGLDEVMTSGDVLSAVRGSIAIPMFFPEVEREGKSLVDGGFSNPVPADVVRKMGADYVIAVDISSNWIHTSELTKKPLSELFDAALSVIEYQLARHILTQADIIIRPPVLSYSWLAFDKVGELYAHGMSATMNCATEICRGTGYPVHHKKPFEKFMDFILYQN